jgi:molybdate transport system permease protein
VTQAVATGARSFEWQRLVRPLLAVAFFAAVVVTFVFITLPVIAIFTHVSPSELVHQLSNPIVTDAIVVTLKTTIVAQVLVLAFGTPTAYFLATRRFHGRNFAITLVELPIVLPPAVAGVGLLVAFGRVGLLGSTFEFLGINLAFNQAAVILAVTLTAGPFYVRQAIAAFEAVDANLVAASRTLGAGPMRTFFRVTMPLAGAGLAAGQAIALARGLGEFGATIMFAGSLQGKTQTLPLAIYYAFELPNGLEISLAISALLVIFSVAILMTVKLVTARGARGLASMVGTRPPDEPR